MAVAWPTAILPASILRQRSYSGRIYGTLLAVGAPEFLIFTSQTLRMGGGRVSGAFVRDRLLVLVDRHVFRIGSETLNFHCGDETTGIVMQTNLYIYN